MLNVSFFPVLEDNYTFILYDNEHRAAAAIDPSEPEPVIEFLNLLECDNLVAIFNTHHHDDHVGANLALAEKYPNLIVYGGAEDSGRIPRQDVFLNDGDFVRFGKRVAKVLYVPGHTRGHIAYYFPPDYRESEGNLFCGDTLFVGGCGRLFEGSPSQMVESLKKLRSLPNNTRVWCAHEYTLNNLEFALSVDPNNLELQKRYEFAKQRRSNDFPTIPSLIGYEKLTNPFLRFDNPVLKQFTGRQYPELVFADLRLRKDNYVSS